MEGCISFYFAHGLASSSQKSGENRYLRFCSSNNVNPLPMSESVLCSFVAYLPDESLKHRTIKTYLSSLRYFQIRAGLVNPFEGSMPRLDYVLKGVKRVQARNERGSRERLPITPVILRKLKEVWSASANDPDTKLIWAACCLCVPQSGRNDDARWRRIRP